MAWPNVTISTSNLDAGTDQPKNARADLLATVQAVNQMITDGPTRGFVELSMLNSKSYNIAGGQTRNRANVGINYQTGRTVVSQIRDNGEIIFQPGIYAVDLPSVLPASSGAWAFSSNTGEMAFTGRSTSYTMAGSPIGTTMTVPQIDSSIGSIFYANTVVSANLNYDSTIIGLPITCIRFTRIG